MAKNEAQSKAESKQDIRDREDAEARGEGDVVTFTNGSGEVKRLSPDEAERQRTHLELNGWHELGQDDQDNTTDDR